MEGVFTKLRNLDAYPKINEDFYSRTFSGGVLTLASSIVMLLLFLSELSLYLHTVTETKLNVDTARGETENLCKTHVRYVHTARRETLKFYFDVTFPAIPCSLLSVDAMDISGEQHLDIRHDIVKKRIDTLGNVIESRPDVIGGPLIEKPLQKHGGRLEHNEMYCGSCFGAEASDDQCCNSCEEVRDAYLKKGWAMTNPDTIDQCKREGYIQKVKEEEGEGCNIHGSLEVNKVAGNFHFSPGKGFHMSSFSLFDLLEFQQENYNVRSLVTCLSYRSISAECSSFYQVKWVQKVPGGMYQYFVKVVPTEYTDIRGHTIKSNQLSVTEHYKAPEPGQMSFPGVFFLYDLSPYQGQLQGGTYFFHALFDKYLRHNWRYIYYGRHHRFLHVPWSEDNYEKDGNWQAGLIFSEHVHSSEAS